MTERADLEALEAADVRRGWLVWTVGVMAAPVAVGLVWAAGWVFAPVSESTGAAPVAAVTVSAPPERTRP